MFISGRQGWGNLLIMLACSAVCSVVSVAVYHVFFSQRTVVMDIAGFITSQREGYARGEVSAGEVVQNIDGLVSRIRAVRPNEAVILDRVPAHSAKSRLTVSGGDDEDEEK